MGRRIGCDPAACFLLGRIRASFGPVRLGVATVIGRMPYTHCGDGRIAVTIDSNVWNQFQDRGLVLADELPSEGFALFMPREIEIELAAIPDRPEKLALKDYIRHQVRQAGVTVTATFGFAMDQEPQRRGGFGVGTFQSEDARAFYRAIRKRYLIGKSVRGNRLSHNEGDAALGASSFASVVLTRDIGKARPLRVALAMGGKILDMRGFGPTGSALAIRVEECHNAP